MNPNDRHDEALASYLDAAGEHPLSRAYRAAGAAQPPEHLDAAVLAASKEAARPPRRRSRGPFARHWTLSAAAAVVAAVALLTAVQIQRGSAPAPTGPAGRSVDQAAPTTLEALPRRKARTPASRAEENGAGTAAAPAAEMYGDTTATERRDVTADPAAWLRRIRALAAAGRMAEARAQLEQLRRRYPDYPVPALPQAETPTTH